MKNDPKTGSCVQHADPAMRCGLPAAHGLYDPFYEHDACGIGFIANIKGKRSRDIVDKAYQMLLNLEHRGACGCEPNTGDGAGMLMQVPHKFFRKVCRRLKIALPQEGEYGVAHTFLPHNRKNRQALEKVFEKVVKQEGQKVLGWRDVPTNNEMLGATAIASEPYQRQLFIGKGRGVKDRDAFERRLFLIRKRAENEIAGSKLADRERFYVCSCSSRTILYKGQLLAHQVQHYYPDVMDRDVESAIVVVHQRYSTNTFPSWDRAQPFRYVMHNGEINTLRGNINWMHTREALFKSRHFPGSEIKKILPVIQPAGSDSAMLDNTLETLLMCGRPLAHAVMMLIPEPWAQHESMSRAKKEFYQYHATLMEPWDGPASIGFTDGRVVGGVLDRNGLRPSRYYVTKDDLVILSSEVGVLDIPPKKVAYKGRLQPGRMLLVDTEQGRIIDDHELKHSLAGAQPYGEWLKRNLVDLDRLPAAPRVPQPEDHASVLKRQKMFGYTEEVVRVLMQPMAEKGMEPVGSMGNDTPLAVLSNRPRPLFDYFKQLFAQVTNPPLDAIREELVTSVVTTIGSEGNLLEPRPENCRQVRLKSPVLSNEELAKIRHISMRGFQCATLPMLYKVSEGGKGLEKAMAELCRKASQAVKQGCQFLILSDRKADEKTAPIPSLLATAGVHHHLIRSGERAKVGLIIESGEPREVHHFALLIGYGAGAVNPYLAFETLHDLVRREYILDVDYPTAVYNYIKAVNKGVVKVMSKMGISTIQSYRGAQIFEAVGLSQKLVDKYFTWTASRVGGIGCSELAEETARRHRAAFPSRSSDGRMLEWGGEYRWRRDGEHHAINPNTIHLLQQAVRNGDYKAWKEYSGAVNDNGRALCVLRDLLEFRKAKPIPVDEVEPAEEIVKRFTTGAMSYGSISKEAHETMAIAMNRLGAMSNTGEGGEDPERFTPDPNGDSRCSAVKQVASGRFGVTSEYLVNSRELQIKMAQGAKPGEGGQLPADKVHTWIAKTRHSTPHVQLISPPPHHDIYSIEDLAQLIYDLKNANTNARISVKLVAAVGVGTVAAGVAKARSDMVLISGHDGGTGASPQSSVKHTGLPWELGLAETHQVLVDNKLRDRIVVQTDGGMRNGRDVAVACLLGAEEFGFGTLPLVTMGCIMMRKCHLDTCPVGVATQRPELRRKFTGKPEHVINFMMFVAREMREIMAELGFRTVDEMVGRVDLLKVRGDIDHWKAKGLDFTKILTKARPADESVGLYRQVEQDHGIEKALDNKLLELCRPAVERGERVALDHPIKNINRTVGTILGSEVTRRHGGEGLPDDTIRINFKGSAGQSFASFLPHGITFTLEGDANDYTCKGLSGGKVAVFPPAGSTFKPEENILVGNVVLYGATGGEAYFNGVAGERFCVRNSGARAVVEGVGDHGCEYMTGGRAVILGKTGRNFAAGMSGGIAYVLDEDGTFPTRVNREMVDLDSFEDSEDIETVRGMLERHAEFTGSRRARMILDRFDEYRRKFVRVMPKDYKRALQESYMTPAEAEVMLHG